MGSMVSEGTSAKSPSGRTGKAAVALSCREVCERLSQFTAGALDPLQALDVEAHLGRCAACAQELRAMQSEDELLSEALSPLRPDASFRARVANACLQIHRHAEDMANSLPPRGWKIFRYSFALLSVLYFVGLSLWVYPAPPVDTAGVEAIEDASLSLFWVNLTIYGLALFLLLGSRVVTSLEGWIAGRLEGYPLHGPSRLEVLTLEALGVCGVVAAAVFHFLFLAA